MKMLIKFKLRAPIKILFTMTICISKFQELKIQMTKIKWLLSITNPLLKIKLYQLMFPFRFTRLIIKAQKMIILNSNFKEESSLDLILSTKFKINLGSYKKFHSLK